MAYLRTFGLEFLVNVGKYTIHGYMDPVGYIQSAPLRSENKWNYTWAMTGDGGPPCSGFSLFFCWRNNQTTRRTSWVFFGSFSTSFRLKGTRGHAEVT